jgi:alpha-tubulin suppressor-like RCC1 family protein
MKELLPLIPKLLKQLSLKDVMRARQSSLFFARSFAQGYIEKVLEFLQQKTVVQVAQGNDFDIILVKDGSVYSRGSNPLGALGLGDVTQTEHFTQIPGLPRIKQIAANTSHAYYLSEAGDVYLTGQDRLALLTISEHTNCFTPRKVPKLEKIVNMGLSKKTSFFVTESGTVFGCGANDEGQVLPGHTGVIQELVEIPDVVNARKVVASSMHTIVESQDQFFSFGLNSHGQLCLGNILGIPKVQSFKLDFEPEIIFATMDCTYILKNDGQLYVFGKREKTFKKLTCIGPAKDCPDFNELSRAPQVDIPHQSLIAQIEAVSISALNTKEQVLFFPPELVEKLNHFSTLLIYASVPEVTTESVDHRESENIFGM